MMRSLGIFVENANVSYTQSIITTVNNVSLCIASGTDIENSTTARRRVMAASSFENHINIIQEID